MTLHVIRKVRSRMYLGITESQTRSILDSEFAATGLVGGSGIILFGGEVSSALAIPGVADVR